MYFSKFDFSQVCVIVGFWSTDSDIYFTQPSRLIVNISEKRITPWIYKITDSNSIVLKNVYELLIQERDELQTRLDQERDSKSKLESRMKKLEDDLISAKTANVKCTTEQNIASEKGSPTEMTDTVQILFQKLKEKNKIQDLLDISLLINTDEPIPDRDKRKDYLVQLGLIAFSKNSNYGVGDKFFKLTEDGEKVLKLVRLSLSVKEKIDKD